MHVDLDEGAGELLRFPRRGRLAGAKADDHVLPPNRLSRLQGDVLNDAIALVEDAEDGDALGHRRNPALPRRGDRRIGACGGGRILLLRALAAGG